MKHYRFTNYRTGERSEPVKANSLVEAHKIIGLGWGIFTITK
jgi:hypothetical protein